MRLEALQAAAIAVSQERSLSVVLKRIVEGPAQTKGMALVRVWLLGPNHLCEYCERIGASSDSADGLHLMASAGHPVSAAHRKEDWSFLEGEFHRGGIKIEQIRNTAKPILLKVIHDYDNWIEKPDWARHERIRSFAGQPLIFRDELLGAIAAFSRASLGDVEFRALQTFAAQAAVAIANARAFDEIDKLRQHLESENAYLREEMEAASGSSRILGHSAGIRRVLQQVEMVAPTNATVLILGETGVGKELVSRAIHERSPRRDGPMVKLNCAAIPSELFESELFGHVKGSFSGAVKDRMGRFPLADGGTLFLDEVGDLPRQMQPKLLRVLQEGEFEAVGDDKPRRVDVRIVAASNHDLKAAVDAGRFREDLFYRLSVFPIKVPPLRERKDDIPVLAKHFVQDACRRFSRSGLRLTASQIEELRDYDWPGNVRELQNVIERAVITARLGSLRIDLPSNRSAAKKPAGTDRPVESEVIPDDEMKRRERENLIAALESSGGRIYGPGGAAELLGLKPTTLSARIRKLGLKTRLGTIRR
jgi:transcriptional regulator with GAF, ATPase, and Fis domain